MSDTIRSATKTGRHRYRILTRLFRDPVLVLQVEWRTTGTHWDIYGNSGPDYQHLVWEDATIQDLTEVNA